MNSCNYCEIAADVRDKENYHVVQTKGERDPWLRPYKCSLAPFSWADKLCLNAAGQQASWIGCHLAPWFVSAPEAVQLDHIRLR